jgi:hypothetical protein
VEEMGGVGRLQVMYGLAGVWQAKMGQAKMGALVDLLYVASKIPSATLYTKAFL